MRFFIKLDLTNQHVAASSPDHSIFDKILDVKLEIAGSNYYYFSCRYHNPTPAISEAFFDHPLYENDRYIMVVSGSVYYRNGNEIAGRCVPSSQELLENIVNLKDDHYRILKGNYYILLYEKQKASALIYSSPFYLTPAYVYKNNNILIFSNHLDFIIESIETPVLNNLALLEFTLFDHSLHNSTLIKDVYLIPGGYKVQFKCGDTPHFIMIYDIAQWLNRNLLSRKESLEKINYLLHDTMHRYVHSTPKFNLSITGGFDGRLNLAFINKENYKNMNAFSYGMPGSNQLSIPTHIANKLGFLYRPVYLDSNFDAEYAELGLSSIFLTSGVTGFNRAVYAYAYRIIGEYSKSCILGQCDMIRPLYNNPAGAIFNVFSIAILLHESFDEFYTHFNSLRSDSFINTDFFNKSAAQDIYNLVYTLYIQPYPELSNKERFYFFLYKESLMKYWHTECHLVNLFVDDFISFSDLDYVEVLHASPYCGLYKGLLADNQLHRRRAHDLYVELTAINHPILNNFFNDRYFKPKWLKYGIFGYTISGVCKMIAKIRQRVIGNETFNERGWPRLFYSRYHDLIVKENAAFNLVNTNHCQPYTDNNEYRKERHLSIKIWMDKHHLENLKNN